MLSRASRSLATKVSQTQSRSMSYFARQSKWKVASLDDASTLDSYVEDKILPTLKSTDGFVGIERYVCANELDYKLVTKWGTLETLLESREKLAPSVETWTAEIKEQNLAVDDITVQQFGAKWME